MFKHLLFFFLININSNHFKVLFVSLLLFIDMATVQSTTTPSTTTTNANNKDQTQQQQNVITFSQPTLDKATKVRMTIENFYENLFQEHEEREERYKRLEESMRQQGLSESEVGYYFLLIVFINHCFALFVFIFQRKLNVDSYMRLKKVNFYD